MKRNARERERQRKCGNRWRKKREQRKKEKEVKGMGGLVVVVVGFEGGRGMDGGMRQTSGRASCSETN